ncbi:MAG TPA: TlpA disulfide reductase family protein, partial [Thermomicrobiales bacterium]|nr:TlpA disulfide reductase family protein [Thermomicrobiales bacterium]
PTSAAQATAIGKPAPDINLPDLKGNPVTLADFAGSPTAVIFWNPGCGFCRKMLDDLKAWETERPAGSPQTLLISTGSIDANKEQGIASTVVLDEGFATGRAFGVSGTPSAVLVDEHGLIASAPSVGGPRVMAMLTGEEIVPDAPATPSVVLQEGDDAPPISLPDLDGNTVSLSDFKGTETLVLFWNPGCGFCQRMVNDLRAFEANASASSPRLLLISTGDIEANRQAGLQAPILIDHGFATGRAYGANGTPSAVLVDANGKIAGPLLVGAPNILAASGHV